MRARPILLAAVLLTLGTLPARAEAPASDPLQERFDTYGDSGQGWTGGDGAYSVPLPDGRTVWLFSDTFLGEVDEHGSRHPNTPLIRNSLIIEDGEQLSTRHGTDVLGRPRALVDTPDRVSWYWMGDGTIEADELRVFAFRFVPVPGPLLFQQIGVSLARFSLPDLSLIAVEPLPRAFLPGASGGPISYGSAILEQDEHTYIYGVEDQRADKFLSVARAPAGDVRGPWEYWTGAGWSSDAWRAVRLVGGVANELSVTAWDDGFLLVAQDHAIGPDILAYDAPAPWGPFTGRRVLATTPETGGNIITYNAKAHPARAPPGELLVTYNVNSWDYADVLRDVRNYRPRFIRVRP